MSNPIMNPGIKNIDYALISADGIGCFACSSSQRACKKDIMDELGSSKDTDCDYCVTLYSTKPNIRKYSTFCRIDYPINSLLPIIYKTPRARHDNSC